MGSLTFYSPWYRPPRQIPQQPRSPRNARQRVLPKELPIHQTPRLRYRRRDRHDLQERQPHPQRRRLCRCLLRRPHAQLRRFQRRGGGRLPRERCPEWLVRARPFDRSNCALPRPEETADGSVQASVG